MSTEELEEEMDDVEEEESVQYGCTLDLFSSRVFDTPEACILFCKNHHQFDLELLKKRHQMDQLSYVRLINYIRKARPSVASLMAAESDELWKDEKYLRPVITDDPLLMIDVDDADDLDKMERDEEHLDHQMNIVLQEMSKRSIPVDLDSATSAVLASDKYYSESYARVSIHHEMLTDAIRTKAYKEAILKMAHPAIKDKRVLDLGCGTAILSLFCATTGEAKEVVAVDASDIAFDAMDIVKENQLDHKIEVLKRRVEDLSSMAKFDVLISEWMGYFLLYEGMIDSIIHARDHLLNKGGLIMPNRCTMHISAVQDMKRYEENVLFWNDVYGFKMSCLRSPFIRDTSIEIVASDKLISAPSLIHSLDMNTCLMEDTEFETSFILEINEKEAKCITALVGYFDCHFDTLEDPVILSTSPLEPATHWKQSVFYLRNPIDVSNGDRLQCVIKVRRTANPRHLHIDLDIDQKLKQSFLIE